jgi:hypothetical protein
MSEETQTEDVQYKVTNGFKLDVLKWINIDDNIREHRRAVKELNQQKKDFEESIITYLTQVDEDSIQIKDGILKKSVTKSKESLKKENIQTALVEITGDASKATMLTEHILKSRKETEKVSLRRTVNRNKK